MKREELECLSGVSGSKFILFNEGAGGEEQGNEYVRIWNSFYGKSEWPLLQERGVAVVGAE